MKRFLAVFVLGSMTMFSMSAVADGTAAAPAPAAGKTAPGTAPASTDKAKKKKEGKKSNKPIKDMTDIPAKA